MRLHAYLMFSDARKEHLVTASIGSVPASKCVGVSRSREERFWRGYPHSEKLQFKI